MNNEKLEQEIVEKGLVAPRVTLQSIKDKITEVEYVEFTTKSGKILRWCVLTMSNGFGVTGKPSCSASIENDNEEIGKKVAYDNAFDNVWELEGYALSEKLKRG